MSKTSEALRERLNIFNTYDLLSRFGEAGKTDISVCFEGAGDARSMRSAGTYIYSSSHSTNPTAHWYDHGKKNFCGKRGTSLPKAIAWASEQYGIAAEDWVPDPTTLGSYVPRVVRDNVLAALKAAAGPGRYLDE